MTVQEIENTLYNLRYTTEKQRHLYGNDNKIRVRMGIELINQITAYNKMYVTNFEERVEEKTVFGYPLEIDYKNPMCLEVCVVEPIHVEGVKNEK